MLYIHWVGQKLHYCFFRKIKDTFFIFTNNFIDLDILSMSLSSAWCNAYFSQLMSQFDHYQLQLVYPTVEQIQREISSTKLLKPLLTHSVSHSPFSILCTNLFFFFLHFSCIFSFLEIIRHNMLNMLRISFHLQY